MEIDDLITWLNQKPNWLIESINLLFSQSRTFSRTEIENLADKCLQEARKSPKKKSEIDSIKFKEYFDTPIGKGKIKLNQIYNVKGINALNPKKPLLLGSENLTVLYGRNGSGKSGYSRILKSACGARIRENLLCDVFQEKQSQSCTFEIEKDGVIKTINWRPQDEIVEDMKTIDIFDSSCGISYVIDEKEVTYEPPLLKFLTYLSQVMVQAASVLSDKLKNIDRTLPVTPVEYQHTGLASRYRKIESLEGFRNLKASWSEGKKKKLLDLQARAQRTHASSMAHVSRSEVMYLEKVINHFNQVSRGLDDKFFLRIVSLKNAIIKKQQQIIDSQKILEGVDVAGIHKQTWKALWEAARDFSVDEVYPDSKYPVTKNRAKCVLCKQELDKPAKQRFIILEKFINNRFNQELKQLQDQLTGATQSIPNLWNSAELREALSSCNLNPNSITKLNSEYKKIEDRRQDFLKFDDVDDLTSLTFKPTITELKKEVSQLKKKIRQYENSQTQSGNQILKKRIDELNTERWITENKVPILAKLKNFQIAEEYNKAKKLCDTTSFSHKQSELAESLITSKFISEFDAELEKLEASDLKVSIKKTRTTKGVVHYAIKLKNAVVSERLDKVLSEGEFRVVSLAAFLADVNDKPHNSPFIFDDPISSMDIEYEEASVRRLIDLSKSRQVIVFTHRLSFAFLLNDEAKKLDMKVNNVTLNAEPWGKGEPAKPINDSQKPDKTINDLIQRLAISKKVNDTEGSTEYRPMAKALTSDFRILVEKCVEDVLLNAVVVRFRRSISTMGKLDKLAKIKLSDTQYLDGLMTKYSKYEHSQPTELPLGLINPEALEKDFNAMKAWIDEFTKRPIEIT